jgi:hypothetical protein
LLLAGLVLAGLRANVVAEPVLGFSLIWPIRGASSKLTGPDQTPCA